MYVLTKNGIAEKCPYSIGDLRRDNPNISFPKNPSTTLLAEWGMYPVGIVSAPEVDYTQKVTEGVVTYDSDSGWRQTWVVTPASPEEIAQRTQAQGDNVRAERYGYLAGSDWTQVADAPVDKAAWATYRQALRDVTQQTGFPWDVQWPVAP